MRRMRQDHSATCPITTWQEHRPSGQKESSGRLSFMFVPVVEMNCWKESHILAGVAKEKMDCRDKPGNEGPPSVAGQTCAKHVPARERTRGGYRAETETGGLPEQVRQ